MLQAHTKGLEEGGVSQPQEQAETDAGRKAAAAEEPSMGVEGEKEGQRTQKPEPTVPSECVQKVYTFY